jgi:ribonuclease J
MGMPSQSLLLVENGATVCFESGEAQLAESVQTGRILVDGKGVGDVGEMVLRDRRRLSEHGMVVVLLVVDEKTGETVYGPDMISRGFVFEEQRGFILEDAKCIVLEVLDDLERTVPVSWTEVGAEIERRVKRFFFSVIERRPIVLPIIMPV